VLIPEGHGNPRDQRPRPKPSWLWRGAVLLRIVAAVAAVLLLDRTDPPTAGLVPSAVDSPPAITPNP
jgi:hypothetical protein